MKQYLLLALLSSTLFASDASTLLKSNCASCHLLTTPQPDQIPTLKAPAMEAVGLHLKKAFNNKEKMQNFIVDYVLNPDASKSICESNKVAKFGVMPSQKGKVSQEDLRKIATSIIETYPTKKFTSMIKEMQTNGKLTSLENSPFLINTPRLPHLTKLLLQNWDKAALALTKEQKEKLLVVRKETLSAIKKIKKEVQALENEIVEMLVDSEAISDIDKKVEQVAKLKTEATKVHIKCITNTMGILNDAQVEFLLPFWDN